MANHVQIAAATDLNIYFCDPHSPWQRGTNENTNGLLPVLPQGQRPLGLHPRLPRARRPQLNNRPRKTLDWKTPPQKPSTN